MPVIVVKIPGITGGCSIPTYQGCISCKTFSIGGKSGDLGALKFAAAGKDKANKGTVESVELTKSLDLASPLLFQAPFAADDGEGADITIDFLERNQTTNTGQLASGTSAVEFLESFMTIVLKNASVVYYSLNVANSGAPAETIKLSFDSLTLTYTDLDNARPQRSPLTPTVTIDISTMTDESD